MQTEKERVKKEREKEKWRKSRKPLWHRGAVSAELLRGQSYKWAHKHTNEVTNGPFRSTPFFSPDKTPLTRIYVFKNAP